MELVFTHENGTESRLPVNGMSTLNVKTWRPPATEEGTFPMLVDDSTIAFNDVVAVSLDVQAGYEAPAPEPVELTPAEAERLEREAFGVAPGDDGPKPWEQQ